MSEDMLERMSIEILEHMLDKNVKRYVRGNINKKNILDKINKIYVRKHIRQEYEKL